MKIIFLGSSAFSIPALEILLKNNIEVALVITQPDKPAGRGLKAKPTPVKELAESKGLVVTGTLPTSAELKKLSPDYLVVVAYGKFLPTELVNEFICVNIHPSLLPKYRGPSPIQTALLNGDAETGVTTMVINEKMDAGDILLQEKAKIDVNENYAELEARLSSLGAHLLLKTLQSDVSKLRKKQNEQDVTLCRKIQNEDSLIDWSKPPLEIHNKVRAITGYTIVNNKRVKILSTRYADGKIDILEVQPEGKKAMSYEEFKRGYKIEIPNSKYQIPKA